MTNRFTEEFRDYWLRFDDQGRQPPVRHTQRMAAGGSTTSTGLPRIDEKAAPPPPSNPSKPSEPPAPAKTKLTTRNSCLDRGYSSRHVQMMAAVGAVGTGLLISSGTGLQAGGPGSLLVGYALMGMTAYTVVTAYAEMAVFASNESGIVGYASRFADPALAFATGYSYFLKYIFMLATNLTAAGLIMQYWVPNLNVALWITVFAIPVVLFNLFHIGIFGEAQYLTGVLKLLIMFILLISCFVASLLEMPERGGRLGFRYWHQPGGFASFLRDEQGRDAGGKGGHFLGVWACIVQAAFAYMGTEVVGVAFSETNDMQREVPRAVEWTFWRIVVFYIGGAIILSMGVPHDSDLLLGVQKHGPDAAASPFIIALRLAKIPTLPNVMNGLMLIFVLSAACSDLYAASRALYALSRNKAAPGLFCTTIRGRDCDPELIPPGRRGWYARWGHGMPLPAVIVVATFGLLLGYIYTGESAGIIFKRLVTLVTVFGLLNWAAILTTYLCWRRALLAQRVDLFECLRYRGWGQPYCAAMALAVTVCVVLGAGFDAFVPRWNAGAFVAGYVGIFLFVAIFFGTRHWRKTKWWKSEEMDLVNHTEWGNLMREVPMWDSTTGVPQWFSPEVFQQWRPGKAADVV